MVSARLGRSVPPRSSLVPRSYLCRAPQGRRIPCDLALTSAIPDRFATCSARGDVRRTWCQLGWGAPSLRALRSSLAPTFAVLRRGAEYPVIWLSPRRSPTASLPAPLGATFVAHGVSSAGALRPSALFARPSLLPLPCSAGAPKALFPGSHLADPGPLRYLLCSGARISTLVPCDGFPGGLTAGSG